MDREDPKNRIVRLMKEGAGERESRPDGSISVRGEGNITAGRDVNLNPIVRPRVVVKTGDGAVDASQKAELQRLIREWIEARMAVRRSTFSFQAAWSAFNRHFGLNSYAELPMEDFGAARAWLQQNIATIASMPSAPRKMPGWRGRTIGAIKARCKNQLGDPRAYAPFIERRFGKSSLAQLSDDELQATRLHVFGRKRP